MNKRKLQLAVLALILLGGLAYGYYTVVLNKQKTEMAEYQNQIEKGQSTLGELEKIQKDKNGTIGRIEGMEQELVNLEKAIPDFSYASEFNLQLYSMLKGKGLKNTIQPQESLSGKGYNYKDINIDVSGKKSEILNFISYLKQQPRKIKIKAATIKILNSEELDASLKIEIFYITN